MDKSDAEARRDEQSNQQQQRKTEDSDLHLVTEEASLEALGTGEAKITKVCERIKSRSNVVAKSFCVEGKRPTSLYDLQQQLGLTPNNGSTGFALTGHSSSLVGRFVSAINPRAILFAPANGGAGGTTSFVTMGFARGEQLVELITSNPEDSTFDFFLVAFKQDCNSRPAGCNFGELLTPAVEDKWTSVTLYQDEDLKNTTLDCRQCHQPGGPGTNKKLLMQELQNPWAHWMRTAGASNVLLNDYTAAHGSTETYAGIAGGQIANSNPPNLERFVRANSLERNLSETFPSSAIANELRRSPGSSPSFNALFDRVIKGEIIPVPYYDIRVTEPSLLAKFTKQYTDVRTGAMPAAALEDIRLALNQDPKELAAMGFAVPQDLPPEKVLTLACAQCHHSKLDPSLSRAKFNVALDTMKNPGEEIDIAIKRLKLGYSSAKRIGEGLHVVSESGKEVTSDVIDHVKIMPPPRFKRLTDEQISALVGYLLNQKARLTPGSKPSGL
jgi:hypothetical protein